MTRFTALIAGIGIGFVLAHLVNSTPKGREFFVALDTRLTEFTGAVADGYRSRDEELRGDAAARSAS